MPRRPRDPLRPELVRRDVWLRIAAMTLLTLQAGLFAWLIEDLGSVPGWLSELVDEHHRWLLYGVPLVAAMLVGLSIPAQRRRIDD